MIFWRLTVIFLILLASFLIILSPKIFFLPSLNRQNVTSKESVVNIPGPVPVANFQAPPNLSAYSAIVADAQNGLVLFEKDAKSPHLPASITKLMTALVTLQNCSPDQIVTVTYLESQPTQMGLTIGDTLTIESLLYGLLMASGNDAAYALATACAPSSSQFVDQMNYQAKRLGMRNSHFIDPAGFDDPAQFTTAHDLALLAKVALANPLLAKIVATKSTVVTDLSGNKTYYLENVNKLLGKINGVVGVKTGQTEGALENLVTKTTRNGNAIITVVLGSEDRFDESKQLIEWAFKNYQWPL